WLAAQGSADLALGSSAARDVTAVIQTRVNVKFRWRIFGGAPGPAREGPDGSSIRSRRFGAEVRIETPGPRRRFGPRRRRAETPLVPDGDRDMISRWDSAVSPGGLERWGRRACCGGWCLAWDY